MQGQVLVDKDPGFHLELMLEEWAEAEDFREFVLDLLSIEVGDIGKSARRSTSYMTSLTRLCPRRFRKTGLGPLGT
jgi:hypothetical protein